MLMKKYRDKPERIINTSSKYSCVRRGIYIEDNKLIFSLKVA